MTGIDLGELVYEGMLKEVYLEYYELLVSYYSPRLALKYDDKFVEKKIESYMSIAKYRSNTQKKRAKQAIKELKGTILITFLNGCFDEQMYQLLKQLKRALGETPEYIEAEGYLKEKVDEEKLKIKKAVKKEEKTNG